MADTESVLRCLTGILQAGHLTGIEQLPGLLARQAELVGAYGTRVFVTDLRQLVLRELTGRGLDAGEGGEEFAVESTLPGVAFRETRILSSPVAESGRTRYWVPVLDGTQRLGVLRADVAEGTPEDQARATLMHLSSLTALLIVSKQPFSDAHARLVRTETMNVAAEMQWKLMPPLAFANEQIALGAAMEPAYKVAGDAFDYATAADTVHLAIFDAMGHDRAAGLTANLAVATCRAQRREGHDLISTARAIEQTLLDEFHHDRYATGVLADLDSRTGELSWINCGHLPPVVIRGGRWVTTLHCPPTHPMGTDLGLPAIVRKEHLEPGDRLLLYTDGITEARDALGREFGLDRFVDFIVRHQADGLPVPETLRRLMRAVLQHHENHLSDDATVVFLEWHGTARNAAMRPTAPASNAGSHGDALAL
ncbi:PP2C family protein-serine/threonine phosphatase [Streptomyces sp. NPDC006208]|uniref:PP2C family protein-serine/threonine phosphatase n=1 Tax=Streptomyces sp. NPDC006208 TaxID=3156734 RepID=UPI0033A940AF